MQKRSAKLLWLLSLGALIGAALATWLAPKTITWYFSPPVDYGVNCKEPIAWALRKLEIAQGLGLLIGAFFGLLAFLVLWRRQRAQGPDQPMPQEEA